MSKWIKINMLVVKPGKSPNVIQIPKEWDKIINEIKEIVGGWLHGSFLESYKIIVYSNANAIKLNLPFNRKIEGQDFYGNIVILGLTDEGKDASLSALLINKLLKDLELN